MKSRANIKGHPLHPLLIAFPIGFLCGALAADALGLLADWPSVWTTGAYLSLAGVASGLVAAVPGLIDYFAVVPPDSSAKTRATYHMVVNAGALVLFALGWVFRDRVTLAPGYGTLALELAGVGLLTAG